MSKSVQGKRKIIWMRIVLVILIIVLITICSFIVVSLMRPHMHVSAPPIVKMKPVATKEVDFQPPCLVLGQNSTFAKVAFKSISGYDKASDPPTQPTQISFTGNQIHQRYLVITLSIMSTDKNGLGCFHLLGKWGNGLPVIVDAVNIARKSAKPIFKFEPKLIIDLDKPEMVSTNGSSNPAIPLHQPITFTFELSDAHDNYICISNNAMDRFIVTRSE